MNLRSEHLALGARFFKLERYYLWQSVLSVWLWCDSCQMANEFICVSSLVRNSILPNRVPNRADAVALAVRCCCSCLPILADWSWFWQLALLRGPIFGPKFGPNWFLLIGVVQKADFIVLPM